MASEMIAEAITDYFGERCPDYDEDCFCCKAWSEYDALTSPTRCVELETVAYYRVNRTHLTHIPHKGYDELVTRSQAEELLASERAEKEKLEAAWMEAEGIISDLKADNASLIHDLNRIKDHETKLINDNAAKDARIKELERRLKEVELEHTGVRNSYFAERRKASTLEADNKRLREALEPFANVAEHDIGGDEDDGDIFWPMSNARYSMAGRLRVGDLRRARTALRERE